VSATRQGALPGRSSALLPLLTAALLGTAGSLDAQLPAGPASAPPVKLEAQPDDAGRKVWHTPNFRIESDVPLAEESLTQFAQVMESTAWVVKHHELPLYAPPQQRAGVKILGRDEDFRSQGGPELAAGYYDGPRKHVLLRASSLVRQPAGGVRRAVSHDEALVIHELVHLNMHGVLHGLPQWFVEGIAEYFSSAHRGAGRFDFSNPDAAIRDYLRARGNPREATVRLVKIPEIAALGDLEWIAYLEKLPESERIAAYGSALLLTHYHLHGGKARIDWLRECLSTPPPRRGRRLAVPVIETEGVEQAIGRYWKSRGLTPEFTIGIPGGP
jgi:hypothetical protein